MILHHYTADRYRPWIMGSGVLIPSESNIGAPPQLAGRGIRPVGEHVGPDVVWLTDQADDAEGLGLEMPGQMEGDSSKKSLRITVEVPEQDAHVWPQWSADHGIDRRWYDMLATDRRPERWWVVERPIESREWLELQSVVPETGRNERCLCGSGAKFKNCHLVKRWHTVWSAGDPLTIRFTAAEISHAKANTHLTTDGRVVEAAADVNAEALADFETDPWGRW